MERSYGRLAGMILAGVLLCTLAASAAGPSTTSSPAIAESPPTANFGDIDAQEFDADRTRFQITVFENGSAEWTFQYEKRLETDEDNDDFRAYAERFNEDETESYRNFRTRATSLAESGSEETGREMTAGTFQRDAYVEERSPSGEEFAVVDMSFIWTAFAERDGDRIVVGDVFVDGLYVGPDQQLRFERGPSVRFDSVEPESDSLAGETVAGSETVTWLGEYQFTDRHPQVVYVDRENGTDSPVTESESNSETTPNDPEVETSPHPSTGNGSASPLAMIALLLFLGVGGGIAYRLSGIGTEGSTTLTEETSGSNRDSGSVHASGRTVPDVGTVADDEQGSLSADELLSDDERVVALLEERGGRMKQVEIVRNTDWSKSKVSMLLTEMEEKGTISKLRVGRENIVSLAGHEPDAARSPFDDDE